MSQPVEPTNEPAAEPQQSEPAAQPETDWKAEADKWKSFARQNEDRAKANAEAAKKLKSIEDRDLSEMEKLKRDNEELSKRAAEAERARLRSDVALAKGIPADVVNALTGNTADELSAAADALLAWKGVAAEPVSKSPAGPKPDKSQGAQPSSKPQDDVEATWQAYKSKVFPSFQL